MAALPERKNRWQVHFREQHQPYVVVLDCDTAGLAMVAFGRFDLMPGQSKRLLLNGKVMHREHEPAPEPARALEGALF